MVTKLPYQIRYSHFEHATSGNRLCSYHSFQILHTSLSSLDVPEPNFLTTRVIDMLSTGP